MSQNYNCVYCGGYVLDKPEHFYACGHCVAAQEAFVGDKERDNAISRLTAAHADGYMSAEKFDERVNLLLQSDITTVVLRQALAGAPAPGLPIAGSSPPRSQPR